MHPILVLEPDDNNRHAFVDDILAAEGILFAHRIPIVEVTPDTLAHPRLVIALQGRYNQAHCALLASYVEDGGTLVSFTSCRSLLGAFDLTSSRGPKHSWIVMSQEAGLNVPATEDLLCPGFVSWRLSGEGREKLKLRARMNEDLGPAILTHSVGKGRLIAFGYDPVASIINLRHGLGDFDATPDTVDLRGPRHIHAIIGIANLYSQQVPICDLHMDLLRETLLEALTPLLHPRVWHFPGAASSMYFLKSDGCGEAGLEKEMELADRFDTPVTFYRNLPSRYPREDLRRWHDQGHGIGIELNLNPITYGKSLAELVDADPQIRERIQEFVNDFQAGFGLKADSVCIHSCQWTGSRMVRLLQEQGWSMADHFCGHDPRLNRHNYGPYCITSSLPMRYYDPEAGVMDFLLQPSQGDESQTVDWINPDERASGFNVARTGFSLKEYAAMLKRFLKENDELYHGLHVGNWHPLYMDPDVLQTEYARFYNRAAFIEVMEFLQEQDIARGQLEHWTRFVWAKNALRFELMHVGTGYTEWQLHSRDSIENLSVMLNGVEDPMEAQLDGISMTIQRKRLEGRVQPYITFSLSAGQIVMLRIGLAKN